MKHYNLADCISEGNRHTVRAQLAVSQQEYEEMGKWFNFSAFYRTCRSMRDMTLESGTDIEKFLKDLQNNNCGFSETKINAF